MNTGTMTFFIVAGIIAAGMLWGFVGCLATDLDEYLGLRIPWLLNASLWPFNESDDTPWYVSPFKGILMFLMGLGTIVYMFARVIVLTALFGVVVLGIPALIYLAGRHFGLWG